MPHSIRRVAVVGAGTMGAAIAAHVANAGLPVLLLDIAPASLTPAEAAQGLSLTSPAVRNRLVQAGFDRTRRLTPPSFMSQAAESLVTLGNVEDDLAKIAEADWIVEAIIEKLEPKRALLERIEAVRRPRSIVTSNTSGLPMASLVEGRSDEFKRHFLGTHFFNPPRTMKLLEIIPTAGTDQAVVDMIASFAEKMLGKAVVYCKDTPNFIGNRLFAIVSSFTMHYALTNGYSIAEVDALTGPLLGRPNTATFRLQDLVGLDVAASVARNLFELVPADPYRQVLRSLQVDQVIDGLLQRGWLGNKSGQGFYKPAKDAEGRRVFLTLNPATFEYELPSRPRFESVEAVRHLEDPGRRLAALLAGPWQNDRAVRFIWAVMSYELAYAAACAPEIAYNLKSIDDTMRWGFRHQAGPFEIWDKLGVADTVEKMEATGLQVAGWVKEMLAAGCPTFYRLDNGKVTGYYDWEGKTYTDLPVDPRRLKVADLRQAGQTLRRNGSASLHHLGQGVLLLEFHAKANTIDQDTIALLQQARALLNEAAYVGLVIGNEGQNFCAGANLFMLGTIAQQGAKNQMQELVATLQNILLAFRYSPKPVVVAVHNRALGGGAEIVLSASRVVAHAESYIGLVEPGVGLVPAGGGVKELVRRVISTGLQLKDTDPLPLAQKVLETIGLAKVGPSAAESRELGFLGATDRVVMNGDHLLYEAKQEVLRMVEEGYVAPAPAPLYAGGRDLYAALKVGVWLMQQAGYISEHDRLIGDKLAYIIAGGDLSTPQWVDEHYFLELERQAFVALADTEKTQARIWHMLQSGKPLRN